MLVHVVMLKFKPEFPEAAAEVKRRLDALPPIIEQIRQYEVGINIVPSDRAYDVSIYSQFDSLETMATYQKHPAHLEALDYIRSVMSGMTAVDYEI
ncbi:MAG: Dabb family protein [Aggregatilineales bacterium]